MAEQDSKSEPLFINLVLMFQMAAWQHLGKVADPMTNKIERNLDQAHFSIDLLEMIRKKTAGNLSNDEKRLLDHAISELQLNYVDEVEKDRKAAEKSKTDPSAEKKAQPETESGQAASSPDNESQADAS